VQKILGHVSILTTTRYTHLTSHTARNTEEVIQTLTSGLSIGWRSVQ
jgi:integrase/recombinase XerD